MLFEPNDMNRIHLGNYEEFFILYMDNELTEDQVKMVDEFLAAHPDLKAEFEMLASTKLPMEEFSFDKNDLLAENMKLSSVDEELLLYIDNELTADQKKTIEVELASNKDYQLQHQVLLQTKLDPSEKIIYPNKKELYHRTERVVSFKVWMRVAAAVVIIAVGGIVYFINPPSTVLTTGNHDTTASNTYAQNQAKHNQAENPVTIASANPVKNDVAIHNENGTTEGKEIEVVTTNERKKTTTEQKLMVVVPPQENIQDPTSERSKVSTVQFDDGNILPPSNNNKDAVTSLPPARNNIINPDGPIAQTDNDRKGSVKGFLRKATRMIEKRTGIDPTNGKGDLLIGAVAINLK